MFVRRLYLCGGGTNAVALGGALEHLEQEGILRCIKEWMGISAGALGAMCLAAGYTVAEMKRFFLEFDYQAITDPDVATGWLMNMGYDTGNRVQRLLNAILKEKGHADTITFEQLAGKTGYSLRVWATNMNKGVLEEFSDKKTPAYCVSHAVRASMTLPYYFQPFKCPISGTTY
jgi:predicted acylesterase/phospholipase RssA